MEFAARCSQSFEILEPFRPRGDSRESRVSRVGLVGQVKVFFLSSFAIDKSILMSIIKPYKERHVYPRKVLHFRA